MGVFLQIAYKNSTNLINKGFIRILLANPGIIIFIFFISFYSNTVFAHNSFFQDTLTIAKTDTLEIDTLAAPEAAKSDIDAPVKYSATDSLYFDMENKTVHLYGAAKVEYQNIELTANYIEFDMSNQTVYATGVEDSLGVTQGVPHFKEGSEEFDAHWIRYNFKTKKGFVYFVKTKQSEGTLIGDSTKRHPNGHVHLKGAKFSTCDLDHPHFYLRLTKAKAVPDDKIVSGPAYLVMADIPLPLILPFGYFPNTKGVSSGLLLPTWGQERSRGFNLRNAGYYFAVSDYFDGSLTTDLYSKGSWAAHLQTNYKLRYRFSGRLTFDYNYNVTSEKGMPNYNVAKDFRFGWGHNQDPKANPTTSFGANVNLSSASYDKNNSYNSDYLTNTKSSSVSYTKRWANAPFNFSSSLNHSQNSKTKDVSFTAPNISFNMNPVYPFRKEESDGDPKWYEDIQFTYSSKFENRINTKDSLFFTKKMFENMKNGYQHSIPLSTNFKITRFINLTPSISYEGMLYSRYMKIQNNEAGNVDTTIYKRLIYAHSLRPNVSLGYSPKIYGMYQFRNSKIKAIRHVMSPSISFGFAPDISDYVPNYNGSYKTKEGNPKTYSYFEGSIYGSPSLPPGRSANINFSLNNNIEMKYLSSNDTASKETKVPILENLNFSGSYNLMADSFNLSSINMSTGTKLFNDKFDIQLTATFDPYAEDRSGRRVDYFAIARGQGLAYLRNADISFSTQFKSGENKSTPKQKTDMGNPSNLGLENDFDDDVIDYSIPWSVNVSYNIGYSKLPQMKSSVTQSMSLSGDLSVTEKWKIGFSTNYDFETKQLAYTRFNLSRDLHCWEMRFDWVPFGAQSNYNFTINALGILQDLKYNKRKDWRDY